MQKTDCDVLIVGCGVAGLYCALNLSSEKKIIMITKSKAEECDSYLAQGGICVLRNEEDFNSYFEDTMKAGHYENNRKSVETMIRSSQDVIKDLLKYGVRFERDENGNLKFTKEGAHSSPRILFHEDITGQEITSCLLDKVRNLPNVDLYENVTMLDITTSKDDAGNERCDGIIVSCEKESSLAEKAEDASSDGKMIVQLRAGEVVLACGGIGGLYEHSTNYPHLTGDALGIALSHNIPLQNPDYIQIHPTTLYSKKKGRAFLISESVRGEGGILLDKDGKRFTDELQPRDIVSNAIFAQMKKDETPYVKLSMERIPKEVILSHFKHIYEKCLEEGYDCTKEPIPVVPAQHYFMGGIDVDADSMTSLQSLYAIGETSCNGVHGRNRLASNSLLESLVFAKKSALKINREYKYHKLENTKTVDGRKYADTNKLFAGYKTKILNEIERMKNYHEQNNNVSKCR